MFPAMNYNAYIYHFQDPRSNMPFHCLLLSRLPYVMDNFLPNGKSLELPYGVGIVGKVGNELGRTQLKLTPSLLDNFISHFPIIFK